MKKKGNRRDCLVTEMTQNLPVVAVLEVAHWCAKCFNGES